MKLRLRTIVVGTLLLCGLFGALWAVDLASPTGKGATLRSSAPKLKTGTAEAGEDGDAPERLGSAWGSVTCVTPEEGKLLALSGTEATSASGINPTLNLKAGDWWIQWESPGKRLSLGHISIDKGEVLRCVLDDTPAKIQGRVVNRRGGGVADAQLQVQCSAGLNTTIPTPSDGRFSIDVEGSWSSGACTLTASLSTGLLQRSSESVEVTVFDRDVPVELLLDDRPVAGLGIVLRMVPEGALVDEIHPGSPAEKADLRANDILVKVDGTSTENMDIDRFRKLATGEVGSRVELEVLRDGKRFTTSFRRDVIEEKKKEDTGVEEGEE